MRVLLCCHCLLLGCKTPTRVRPLALGASVRVWVCSFSISERLSGLHRLRSLALDLSCRATYGGGIEHLPALQTLTIRGITDRYRVYPFRIVELSSSSLTGLTIIVRPSFLSLHGMYLLQWSCKLEACCANSHYVCFIHWVVCMACRQGQGVHPLEHLLLGHLPAVASHERRFVRELTHRVLHDILRLRALTVRLRPSPCSCLAL